MKGSGTRLPMRGKEDGKRSLSQGSGSKGGGRRGGGRSNASTPNSSTSSSKSTQKKKAALGRDKNDRCLPVESETAAAAAAAGGEEEREDDRHRLVAHQHLWRAELPDQDT